MYDPSIAHLSSSTRRNRGHPGDAHSRLYSTRRQGLVASGHIRGYNKWLEGSTMTQHSGAAAQSVESGAEYDALRNGAGVCVLPGRTVVRMVGDDRVSFLHGMCSNDIRNARAGTVVPALFLTEHAHLIADFFAWIDESSILIEADSAAWARAREHLEKLLVADDVEFEDQPDVAIVDIVGPRAEEAVRAVAEAPSLPERWRWTRAGNVTVANLPRFGADGYVILTAREKVASAVAAIASLGAEFRKVGPSALEIVRVENGIARVGVDTSDKTIALEARMNRAISFEKGCYVGQETIERATARGGLKKKLLGLRIEGDRLPCAGAPIVLDGKEVGRISSVVHSPRFGAIGLAVLQHSAWKPDTRVAIADSAGEVTARVCDVPFQ
jgi:folate-binding protein YgfZ